ncbi:MAG: hypothetical protein GYA76_08985 [Verrucomicrobia bacterium]|nr:hypothetical protein [Verrucomicrobiota bacterium]HOU57724.1 WD40 repeat domain-containing protein [Smithellaceae bacterium]
MALSHAGLLATAGWSSVRIWRTSDWTEAYSLAEHAGPVAFSPDGRWLAATSPQGVAVYSGSDGKLVAEIPDSLPPFAFSPRGNLIAVDTPKGIALKNVESGQTLRQLEHSEGLFSDHRMRYMNALAFSSDGNSVVAARNILREGSIFALDVWSTATGVKAANLPTSRDAVEHVGMLSAIAFAPSGQLLASGSHDHSIRLWALGSRECVDRLYGNPSEVWAVAFSADGRGVLSGAKDGMVRFWPTNAPSREKLYEGNWKPVKFSKDGRVLAVIDDQTRFALMNLKTGEPEDSLQLNKSQFGFWTGAISDDFRTLVDPFPDGGIRVWDLESKKSADIRRQERATAGSTSSTAVIKSHGIYVPWTAISPDGKGLLTGTGNDSMLWWNLQDPAEAPLCLVGKAALFSRNGNVLVTLLDHSIKVWTPKDRSLKGDLAVEGSVGFLASLALSDDGYTLALSSAPLTETENAIRMLDTRSGKLLGACKGHTQGVRGLAFSPDGETLASVSDDSTLRFWNVATQQELLSIRRLAEPIREIIFSPDGNWLVAKTTGGLRFLDASRDHVRTRPASLGNSSARH